MKNLINTCLPVLALLALGGCAGTSALTSSEDDGVYYSSKDRTTAVVSQAPAPASTNEAANPDYNGNTDRATTAPQGSGSTQYYDNTYSYMQGAPGYGSTPYYGPGVGSYSPYSPYTSLSYAPYMSGYNGFGYGYSPYAYGGYDPFYNAYAAPYMYGCNPYYRYGAGLNISFGFGQPYGYGFGYGGYGYNPYAYGYGYSPYYYGGAFYGGYYGRGGYYGNSYYGSRYYDRGSNYSRRPASNYHRAERGSEGRYATGSGAVSSGNGTPAPVGTGRTRSERVAPATNGQAGQLVPVSEGGRKRQEVAENPYANMTQPTGSYNQPRRLEEGNQPRNTETMPGRQPYAEAGQLTGDNRGRLREQDAQPTRDQPQAAGSRSRGGFFQNVFGQPASNGQTADQPTRRRSYDQPQPTRQRTYEQPQRSYEQPSRSYSAPSYGGGGNSGGGGGGRRGRN